MRFVRPAVLLVLVAIAVCLYILCRKQGINPLIPASTPASQLATMKQTDQEREFDKKIAEMKKRVDQEFKESGAAEAEFDKELAKMHKLAKEHVDAAVKECADFKKKLYASGLDKEQKDLIWGAVLVGSEYCWQVDVPKPRNLRKAALQKPAKKSVLSEKTK